MGEWRQLHFRVIHTNREDRCSCTSGGNIHQGGQMHHHFRGVYILRTEEDGCSCTSGMYMHRGRGDTAAFQGCAKYIHRGG
jgi:hypothetical protein